MLGLLFVLFLASSYFTYTNKANWNAWISDENLLRNMKTDAFLIIAYFILTILFFMTKDRMYYNILFLPILISKIIDIFGLYLVYQKQ